MKDANIKWRILGHEGKKFRIERKEPKLGNKFLKVRSADKLLLKQT